jgi:Ecdysteroid kinase-like family
MGHAENEAVEAQSGLATVLAELTDEKYQAALRDIIKNNFDSPIDELNVKMNSASNKGDNYIGILHRVSVEDSNDKKLHIILKLPPTNVVRREQFFARPCFLRESEFYESVYPMYKKFQEEKGIVVEDDGFYEVPKCYTSLTEDLHEGLFLEDLKVSGFEMFDRFSKVTKEHVTLVMEALGKFHAICFAFKDQRPEALDTYREMQDIFMQRDENSKEQITIWFDMLKKQAFEALATMENPDLVEKGKNVLEGDFFELLMQCIEGKNAEPHAIITHGDCWNNNIMYRNEVNN